MLWCPCSTNHEHRLLQVYNNRVYSHIYVDQRYVDMLFTPITLLTIGKYWYNLFRLREETRHMQKTYATVDRTTLAYYRPVNVNPATNQQTPPSWDAPLTDKEAATVTSYPGQCSCGTLPSRDSRNTSIGGSVGKPHHVYNSISGE